MLSIRVSLDKEAARVKSNEPMTIIQSFILAYCFLLSGFLLTRCWQSPAARYLVSALSILASAVGLNYGVETGLIAGMPAWRWALPIFLGPVLYGLTSSLIRPLSKRTLGFHLLLAGLPTFLVISWAWLSSHQVFTFAISSKQIGLGFSYLYLVCYLVMSFRLLRSYSNWLPSSIAASETLQLRWLSFFLALIVFLVVIELTEWFAPFISLSSSPYFYFLEMGFLALALLMLTLEILQRPDGLLMQIVSVPLEEKPDLNQAGDIDSATIEETVSEANSELGEQELENDNEQDLSNLLSTIDAQITMKELYRIPNLSLTQLANEVALTPRELSYVINKVSSRNFSDFINAYRVREVARILSCENAKNINLLELSLEVGFNSKSTFNTMFKREFGCTPSEFRKKKLAITAKS